MSLLDSLGPPRGVSVSPRTPKGSMSPLPGGGAGACECGGPPSPQGHLVALRWGVRRDGCSLSPGGWVSPASKDRSSGLLTPKGSPWGFQGAGFSVSHQRSSRLLPFPQGLGSHHSGLRTIKDWEPEAGRPQAHHLQAPNGQGRTKGLGHLEACNCPIGAG